MREKILLCIIYILFSHPIYAQLFTDYFQDKTLRIDYQFVGNARQQTVCLDELSQLPTWAGRRTHLSDLPLEGNGQVIMTDLETGKCIYKTSFSTLFQEWLDTEEAKSLARGFENTFLLPYPLRPVEITVLFREKEGQMCIKLKHVVRPDDILIHAKGKIQTKPYKYLMQNGTADQCIDLVILGEGYTKEEMSNFYQHAQTACESLFEHEPFRSLQQRFNVIAVESASLESGVSSPGKGEWKETAFGSHFDTFYSQRYLTSSRMKDIHNSLAGIPYEHIIILANTDQYGGGGIYNAFALTTAKHKSFGPVVVHEFGHSFGGLADEYYYEGEPLSDLYSLQVEPWEQNITTLIDFKSKWEDLLQPETPIPTLPTSHNVPSVGVYEGGGYSFKGIYRPAMDCRMKTNEYSTFCPVCQRALERLILFYTNND